MASISANIASNLVRDTDWTSSSSSSTRFHGLTYEWFQLGRTCGYEEDVNIPLIIRGPKVPQNHTANFVISHTILAPTILEIIGQPTRPDFDEQAIPLTRNGIQKAQGSRQKHVNVEF